MSTVPQTDPTPFLDRFGLTSFRDGQREVIDTVLAGRDCMCIMPTGGGKSLCYQLPAIANDGVTLVVSPLIALMKDQVDGLQELGLRASFINSSLSSEEQADCLEMLAAGGYDLLYVAPERFRHQRFLESLRQTKLSCLAIDEAHCISEWGHDFRPDYNRLGEFRRRLGNPPTIALTATATKRVRDDVIEILGLEDPAVFITGFARPNLRFEVTHPGSKGEKERMLLDFLEGCQGAGIIYAATRKRCDELVDLLRERTPRRVGMYHAGMEGQQRRSIQEAFMANKVDVIVATNAFGMGIDKSDLRFVLHYNIPGSLEAYYQEAGRAGRDGLKSRCQLMYSASDRYIQEFFIENAYPARETIATVWDFLREQEADPIELTQEEIKEALGGEFASGGIGACLQILDRCGAVERLAPQQNMAAVRISHDAVPLIEILPPQAKSQQKALRAIDEIVGDRRHDRVFFTLREAILRSGMEHEPFVRALRELNRYEWFSFVPPFRGKATHVLQRDREFEQLEIDFEKLDALRAGEYHKLDLMIRYAQTPRCRQIEILEYFGDPHRERCGTCDRCEASPSRFDTPKGASSVADDSSDVDFEKLTEVVRMALSGIARTDARFGKKLVSQMLYGSDTAQVRKWRLERLSTYGLFSHLLLKEVEQILDTLTEWGLATQKDIDKFRPVVTLTDAGKEAMRGISDIPKDLRFSREIMLKIGALRRRSRTEKKATKTQPAPVLAEEEPKSSHNGESGTSPSRIDLPDVGAPQPAYYWTWHLLADGYAWPMVLAIRGITSTEALMHLQQALAAKHDVDPRWFLSPSRLAEVGAACDSESPPNISLLQETLGDGWLLEEIDLYLKCRVAN